MKEVALSAAPVDQASGYHRCNEENAAVSCLQVGYGKVSIMPETEIPLGGYGNSSQRISTGIVDCLYSTCIAMTQDNETVLLFTYDMVRSLAPWTQAVRERIHAEFGIPADHIMLCATHCHSGPENTSKDPRILAYKELFVEAMAKAAKIALEDRAPATMSGVKSQVNGMAFVRHYKMSDGSYAGANFGNFKVGTIVGHATKADDEMILVKFARGEEKQDILLMNWNVHPDMSKQLGFYNIASSFVGPLRNRLEKLSGMQVAYFTGDAGNQNARSKIASEATGLNYFDYGEKMADYAYEALPRMTAIHGSGIRTAQVRMEYPLNHANEDKLLQAQEVVALGNTDEGKALAKACGLGTYREARNVIARLERPTTGVLELNAIYIAGMAFITAPYEMFSDNGIFIKENSPFEITLLFTNANDWNSYCAADYSYDFMCYESSAGHFARGCAEDSANQLVELLNRLQ